MSREEQIEDQASEYANDPDNTIEWGDGWIDFDQVFDAFKNGAEWADEHPQFSKEEFIEKACDWLRKHSSAGDEVATIQFNSIEEMIESLKNYMEE